MAVSASGLNALGNLAGANILSPSVGTYGLGPQGLGSSDSAGISPCSRAQLGSAQQLSTAYESADICRRLSWHDTKVKPAFDYQSGPKALS